MGMKSSYRKKNNFSGKKSKMMTFAEMKEYQRVMQDAHMAPGAYKVEKTFGSDVHHKMPFGKKYTWKPDSNPPPGSYNP